MLQNRRNRFGAFGRGYDFGYPATTLASLDEKTWSSRRSSFVEVYSRAPAVGPEPLERRLHSENRSLTHDLPGS
jgi:hypothetical protein